MKKEKDYEQLYFDLLYEFNKLKKENEQLNEELNIYNLNKDFKLKCFINKQMKNYFKKKEVKNEKH